MHRPSMIKLKCEMQLIFYNPKSGKKFKAKFMVPITSPHVRELIHAGADDVVILVPKQAF